MSGGDQPPADPIVVLVGPDAGSTISPDDLSALSTWYLKAPSHGTPTGRPYVTALMVATVDGAAAVDGVSGAISPAVDRTVFRVLRATCDVILVGAGTARSENYGPWEVPAALRAPRAERGQSASPVIAQVTSSGNVHTGRDIFRRGADGSVGAVAVTGGQDPQVVAGLVAIAGADAVITAPADSGGVDMASVLAEFARRGWSRVLCEGGPTLLGDLLAAGLVDELCLTVSPLAGVGGSSRIVAGPDDRTPVPARLHALAASGSVLLSRWTFGDRGSRKSE